MTEMRVMVHLVTDDQVYGFVAEIRGTDARTGFPIYGAKIDSIRSLGLTSEDPLPNPRLITDVGE